MAAEWCLPLVAEGGAAILWVGPSADLEAVAAVAGKLAAAVVESPPGFLVLRKTGPTPAGLPAPARDGAEAAARLSGRRRGLLVHLAH